MRSTWLTTLAPLALVTATFTLPLIGCSDQDAVRRAEDRKKFDAALAKLQMADMGFVPQASIAQTPNYQDYRQGKLDEAAVDLTKITDDPTASPSDRDIACRLLADTYTSKARYFTRHAIANWSKLANDSSKLLAMLTSVDRANSRAGELSGDNIAPLLASLEKDKSENDRTLQDFDKSAAELGPQVDKLKDQIAKLQAASDQSLAKSRELYDQGFTAKGDEQFKLYEASANAQRESTAAEAKRRTLAVQLELVSAELAIANKQRDMRTKTGQAYSEQIQAAENRQSGVRKLQDDAISQQKQTIEDLEKELGKIEESYVRDVESKFGAAAEQVKQAIALIDPVAKAASGTEQKQLQLDLLSKYTTLANIQAQHAVAASGYANVIEILASQSERLMPGRATIGTVKERITKQRDEVFDEAINAISGGSGLAAQLMPADAAADDPILIAAQTQRDLLDRASQLVNQLRTPAKKGD
ncbi:MAG: hypothetical protein IT444_07105 [Phycisphaeraceae bacterium]|nr:hypothetical protein [Phycisphaeraceae bacterium]